MLGKLDPHRAFRGCERYSKAAVHPLDQLVLNRLWNEGGTLRATRGRKLWFQL